MDHYMETLDESKKLLYKGMKEITQKGDLNASTLEMLGNTIDAIKDICEIEDKDMGMDANYGRYPMYTPIYEARGRRRDSMGRYMDSGMMDSSYNNYGADSYRRDNEDPEYLEYKMRNATSDQERDMYRRKLEQVKNR